MDFLNQPSVWDESFGEVYARTHAPNHSAHGDQQEADFVLRVAGAQPGDRLLDCPCGFGRHANIIAQKGYSVVGVDRSADQLREAHRRGGEVTQAPEYIQGDYRELDFPDASFDAIACLSSSLGYLDIAGDLQVLTEFKRLLRPGRRLVLELGHRDFYIRTFMPKTVTRLGDGGLYVKERQWDPRASTVHTTHTMLEPAGQFKTWENSHRFSDVATWEKLLRQAGFTQIDTRSGFSDIDITQDFSQRAVFIAS